MKKALLILAASAAISGCATSPVFQEWVGLDSEQLIVSWGAPKEIIELKSGGRVMNYRLEGNCEAFIHEAENGRIEAIRISETGTVFCSTAGRNIDDYRPK